jgi:hypothetical protein
LAIKVFAIYLIAVLAVNTLTNVIFMSYSCHIYSDLIKKYAANTYKTLANTFFSGAMSILWAVLAPKGAVHMLAMEMMIKPGR